MVGLRAQPIGSGRLPTVHGGPINNDTWSFSFELDGTVPMSTENLLYRAQHGLIFVMGSVMLNVLQSFVVKHCSKCSVVVS